MVLGDGRQVTSPRNSHRRLSASYVRKLLHLLALTHLDGSVRGKTPKWCREKERERCACTTRNGMKLCWRMCWCGLDGQGFVWHCTVRFALLASALEARTSAHVPVDIIQRVLPDIRLFIRSRYESDDKIATSVVVVVVVVMHRDCVGGEWWIRCIYLRTCDHRNERCVFGKTISHTKRLCSRAYVSRVPYSVRHWGAKSAPKARAVYLCVPCYIVRFICVISIDFCISRHCI